ncbi:MAG: hypothetical protein C0622_13555 [Desulfuromonas sp.]|nr:MAG: hypothetical protein C0622_13555 [Desulfuromonas sp.]
MRFSKISAITFIIFFLFVTSSIAENEQRYVHFGLGFSIVKPANWSFALPEMNLVAIDKEFLNDEELQNYLDNYTKDSFFSILQEQISDTEYAASIRARVKKYKSYKGRSAVEILEAMAKYFPESFNKYKLLQPPREVELSGFKSAHILFEYTVDLENNSFITLKSDVWIVPSGKYFFIIDAGTNHDDQSGKREEILNILETLVIRG